jgi:hypothetical protein
MSESAAGCLGVLSIVAHVAAWIGTGIFVWNWLEPDSFGRVLIFLLAWGIIGKIADFILHLIIMLLASLDE